MADPMSGPITRCPWCSAELPAPNVEHCPSCGAALTSATGTEPQLPGVTSLDPQAIIRARSEVARPRSRILSFLTGEVPSDNGAATNAGQPVDPASFAPPSDEVRREMLRLQIEAERADLEAEAVALKADALAQLGVPLAAIDDEPDAAAAGETAVDPAEATADADDARDAGEGGDVQPAVPNAPPTP